MSGKYIRTPKIRAQQSAAMKGRFAGKNSSNFGRKVSNKTRLKMSQAKKDKPASNKGVKYSEKVKQNMSFGKIGVRLTPIERAERKKLKTKNWMRKHPEKTTEYNLKFLKSRAFANAKRRKKLRTEIIIKLGGRCSSKTCGWVNNDGSRGCTDFRILQIDHIEGGGTKERKILHPEKLYRKVLIDKSDKYQLLCANCNWIKALEEKEFLYKYKTEKTS